MLRYISTPGSTVVGAWTWEKAMEMAISRSKMYNVRYKVRKISGRWIAIPSFPRS